MLRRPWFFQNRAPSAPIALCLSAVGLLLCACDDPPKDAGDVVIQLQADPKTARREAILGGDWWDPRSVELGQSRAALFDLLGSNVPPEDAIVTFPHRGPDFESWPRRQDGSQVALRFLFDASKRVSAVQLYSPLGLPSLPEFEKWRAHYGALLGKEASFRVELKCRPEPTWDAMDASARASAVMIGCAWLRVRWLLPDRRVDLGAAKTFFGLVVEANAGG